MRKSALLLTLAVVVLAGCASSGSDDGPPVEMQVTPLNYPSDILYFRGPVALDFALTVHNPTNEPVHVNAVDLRTLGPGAWTLRSGQVPVNRTVPPGATSTFRISAWAYARGGYLSQSEPVTLRVLGYFNSPSHKAFVKMGNQIISG